VTQPPHGTLALAVQLPGDRKADSVLAFTRDERAASGGIGDDAGMYGEGRFGAPSLA
jgi:hypothetical protein